MQKKESPETTVEELAEAFADHDRDGSGSLSLEEWNKPFDDAVSEMMRTSAEHAANEVPLPTRTLMHVRMHLVRRVL